MHPPVAKRVFPQMVAWAGLALFCAGGVAQAAGSAQSQPAHPQGSSTAPAASQRTDGQIEMDVVKALDAAQTLKDDLITAATIQSEVTLSGTVSSQASKDLAASIAAKVPGVTKVHDNLTVGNPQQAAAAANLPGDQTATDDVPGQGQAPPQSEPMPGPDNSQAQPPADQSGPDQTSPDQANQGPPPPPGPPQASPYPPARPQYSPYPAPPPPYGNPQYGDRQTPYSQPRRYEQATGPVTVPQGALIQARTSEPVDSKHAAPGTPVQFTLVRDVTVGGVLAIPRGATLHGVITDTAQSGKLTGHAELALTLTSFDLGGQNYPIHSDEFRVKSPDKAGRTLNNAVAGGLLGTIVGCMAGRGVGCAIGAGAGAAAGTAASAASSGPHAWIPAEALVAFHVASPVTVNPVSQQEADRLAQGLYQGGPSLRRRGYPPPPPYYYYRGYGYPYPPMYGYPPVYYRPYYMMGGVYYWR